MLTADQIGAVESVRCVAPLCSHQVKAASDIVAPVAGTITAVNDALADAPGDVNADAMAAWFFRIRPADGVSLDSFMDEAAYQALIG